MMKIMKLRTHQIVILNMKNKLTDVDEKRFNKHNKLMYENKAYNSATISSNKSRPTSRIMI